jgi:hypothetical protein
MVTFDKVLHVFSDYLAVDTEVEVVKSKYGYIVLYWEDKHQELCYAKTCATPNSLFDELLSAYDFFRVFLITRGDGELPAEIRAEIDEEMNKFRARLNKSL